ncbi:MAG: UbiA family prenyltransferase [Rhodothermales bacterium]|nr:UbiA family prenyltransferase [Rhodothermales bacterium]
MTDKRATGQQGKALDIKGWLEYSQLHIGLVAIALCSASYSLLESQRNEVVVLLCFCGATVVYVFDRLVHDGADEANHPSRTRWFEAHRSHIWWLSRLLAVACVPLVWMLNPLQILLAAILASIGLGYVVPPRPLRDLRRLKPFLIAGAWTIAVVGLAGLDAGINRGSVLLLLAYRFAYLVPNTMISDLLDAPGDRDVGYETVATTLTIPQVKAVVLVSIICAVGILLSGLSFGVLPAIVVLDAAGMLIYLPFVGNEVTGERKRFFLDCALIWPLILVFV